MATTFEELGIELRGNKTQQKVKCPNCVKEGKKHNDQTPLSVNQNTKKWHCHKCGWKGMLRPVREDKVYDKPVRTNFSQLSDDGLKYAMTRGISQSLVVAEKLVERKGYIVFPYERDREMVNFKARMITEKKFAQGTNCEQIMYRYDQICNEKTLIITEGEWDALSLVQAGFRGATSVSQGAPNEQDKTCDAKLACISNCYEVFEQAELVIIAVDNDPNGKRLEKELVRRIGAEKCKTISFGECKDANGYLQKYGVDALRVHVNTAEYVEMEGITRAMECLDKMIYNFETGGSKGTPTHFMPLENYWTWRPTEVNIWSGYTNEGKTTFLNFLMVEKASKDKWKFAIFSPESLPSEDYYDDLVHTYVGKTTDSQYRGHMSKEELIDGIKWVHDHFFLITLEEDQTLDAIFEKFEYLVHTQGVNGCVIDPYNQVEHMMNAGEREDLYISRFMTRLKKFAIKHDISMNLVAHQNTPFMQTKDLDYPRTDMYKIKGGGTFSDKADNVLLVQRPYRKSASDNLQVNVYIDKIKKRKLTGQTGEIRIYYNFLSNGYDAYERLFNDISKDQDLRAKTNPNTEIEFSTNDCTFSEN